MVSGPTLCTRAKVPPVLSKISMLLIIVSASQMYFSQFSERRTVCVNVLYNGIKKVKMFIQLLGAVKNKLNAALLVGKWLVVLNAAHGGENFSIKVN